MTSATARHTTDLAFAPSVLWKAFDVLGSFSQSRRVLTLSELSRRSGLPKSTVHRILTMLVEVKAVERAGQGYRMGVAMFSLGTCSTEVALRDLALPHLERLRRQTGQTVHLAVLDGSDVVYLEKLAGASGQQTPAVVGGRLPAHGTGVGKAMLAFNGRENAIADFPDLATRARTTATLTHPDELMNCLDRVRTTGMATDREEAVKGLACVAVPILVDSRAVAAVSVAFPVTAGSGQQFVSLLRETTAMIARAVATGNNARTSEQ